MSRLNQRISMTKTITEIIKAAKALEKIKSGKPSKQDCENAILACFAALYSPELASGECPITVLSCKTEISVTHTEVKA